MAGWLLHSPLEPPHPIATELRNGLFTSLPIFLGGVLNTTLVAAIAYGRHPTPPFFGWLLFELVLGALRFGVIFQGRMAIRKGQAPPRYLAALLALVWSASVGAGTFLCLLSADWVLAAIACLSAAAMICGICLRNFGTPRLATLMVCATVAPCAVAGLLSPEPVMIVISFQLPVFLLTIFMASFNLHKMLVSRMVALSELERSQSLNRTILQSSPDPTFLLDEDHRLVFCNPPGKKLLGDEIALGAPWVSMLPVADRTQALRALEAARSGPASLVIGLDDESGKTIWLDLAINSTIDALSGVIVVARDITRQKKSEEKALWMARHDALTRLPNRTVLQDHLDQVLAAAGSSAGAALLIIDVDNFKAINDSFGHDCGDALLCTVAKRLHAAVGSGDLVARTGGDEFTLVITIESEADVMELARRIYAQLEAPVHHRGRLVECGVSIGASLIPCDGTTRLDILKAADLALYAAKSGGRGQIRMFAPAMMAEADKPRAMIALARDALQRDAIVPYYQPKVSLHDGRIVGFEALLRWSDHDGALRGPDALMAAFEDPAMGASLSHRMLARILDDVESWAAAGVAFGHVALNVSGIDLRRPALAEMIRTSLGSRKLPTRCLQIEVTEQVFLGRGSDQVQDALQRLSDGGIRIALDDFGTGHGSLSHLNRFPVDILKVDRSFVSQIGHGRNGEAIASAIIGMGRALGLETVAEGIETRAQELYLRNAGCDVGQGFLYSPAIAAADVPTALLSGSLDLRPVPA
ncbi:bifunctional diguanylate cyclase/phosphodiesterase [Sphingobium sp. CFD-2]|uniref:putative bifunctional diguanylate cyclase/phosphodiesterase n=1 Tax=Sphingobium sp. CFD-2 TaxID=2878542 RepID=UPI00214B5B56|nr:EAL domain-containing protein [Sphingobium sp. CFD-2]